LRSAYCQWSRSRTRRCVPSNTIFMRPVKFAVGS
jgi:hypothetical protein